MDYTLVFRPLIYKDRKDIDDFPIYENDSIEHVTMESVFMERLEERYFIRNSYNAPELLLMIFNNARFITTLILSENHPQHYLQRYMKIAENESKDIIVCNHAMPATMALVVNYLLHYFGEIFCDSKIVKAIINNFEGWHVRGASEGKQDFYELLIDRTSEKDKYPRWATDSDFERRDIREVITDNDIEDIEFTGCALDYIIDELFIQCTDNEVEDFLILLKNRVIDFERTVDDSGIYPEMIEDTYQRLKKVFRKVGMQWEKETTSSSQSEIDTVPQNVKSPSPKVVEVEYDHDKEILFGKIDHLEEEVDRLTNENKNLNRKLSLASSEIKRLDNENDRLKKSQDTPQIVLTNNSNFARVVQAMVSARYFKRANGDETNATEVGGILLKLFGVSNTWKSVLQKAYSREDPLKTFDELRTSAEKYWANRYGLTKEIREKGKK